MRTWTRRIFSRPTTSGFGNDDLAVEAARTQQRRIEHVGTVGGGDDDHALVGLEAVHLDQQLVEGLLALVVAAAEAGAAMAADRVDLVDEDDAGGVLLRLLEHVAHAGGADADEHLDEVRAGDGEERHVGLARDRTGGQGLTGAGRADEQHAARNAAAEALEFLRIAQELHDLLQVLLGLVDAGDVVEGDAAMRLRQKLRLGLAEAHGPAGAALHLARQEDPGADEERDGQDVHEDRDEPGSRIRLRTGGDLHALLLQLRHQHRIARRVGREGATVGIGAADLGAGDHHAGDAPGIGIAQKLAIGDVAAAAALAWALEKGHERQHQEKDDDPQGEVAEI